MTDGRVSPREWHSPTVLDHSDHYSCEAERDGSEEKPMPDEHAPERIGPAPVVRSFPGRDEDDCRQGSGDEDDCLQASSRCEKDGAQQQDVIPRPRLA
jgi:hypothetical protein